MAIYYPPTRNFIQKTLNAQLLTGATASATLNNATYLQNAAGVMIIDRINSAGVETPNTTEVILFAGTSGSTVTTLTRGQAGTTDQDHEVGAIVEFGPDILWAQGLIDTFVVGHTAAGAHIASLPLTTPILTTPGITGGTATGSTYKNSIKEVVTTAGGTTTYTLTPSVAIAAYATGQEFVIKMNATNTGASTINISGLGAKSLTKGGATALASGDLLIDAVYKIVYDGTQFQVSGVGGAAATAATQAEVATGTSNTLMATPLGVSRFHMPPQGFLYNGKIVPSVASNNLTVALKGLDGNDASASNPIYVRIGDTVRTITAALSVTKNAGTNWFGAGATGLATYEIDYFTYLGYNDTDGVVIGFSRLPAAQRYADFSATSTNDHYCAISTITTAAATDYYENIGRFGATLSATAAFNWSVPAFTATNLIQSSIRYTRALACDPPLAWTAGVAPSGSPVKSGHYWLNGNQCTLQFMNYSYTNGTTVTGCNITLPMTQAPSEVNASYVQYVNAGVGVISYSFVQGTIITSNVVSSTVGSILSNTTYGI